MALFGQGKCHTAAVPATVPGMNEAHEATVGSSMGRRACRPPGARRPVLRRRTQPSQRAIAEGELHASMGSRYHRRQCRWVGIFMSWRWGMTHSVSGGPMEQVSNERYQEKAVIRQALCAQKGQCHSGKRPDHRPYGSGQGQDHRSPRPGLSCPGAGDESRDRAIYQRGYPNWRPRWSSV